MRLGPLYTHRTTGEYMSGRGARVFFLAGSRFAHLEVGRCALGVSWFLRGDLRMVRWSYDEVRRVVPGLVRRTRLIAW